MLREQGEFIREELNALHEWMRYVTYTSVDLVNGLKKYNGRVRGVSMAEFVVEESGEFLAWADDVDKRFDERLNNLQSIIDSLGWWERRKLAPNLIDIKAHVTNSRERLRSWCAEINGAARGLEKTIAELREQVAQEDRDEPIKPSRERRGPDPYALLGIQRGASQEEIRAAYRREVARYHPDKVMHLGERIREMAADETRTIIEAYESLASPKGRN